MHLTSRVRLFNSLREIDWVDERKYACLLTGLSRQPKISPSTVPPSASPRIFSNCLAVRSAKLNCFVCRLPKNSLKVWFCFFAELRRFLVRWVGFKLQFYFCAGPPLYLNTLRKSKSLLSALWKSAPKPIFLLMDGQYIVIIFALFWNVLRVS